MRVDFHTHSVASPDGALTVAHYKRMLQSGRLNLIAVTDHNTTRFARALQAELGDKIIVGEEITTREGEIIGLYLTNDIPAGLSAAEAVRAIKQQGGLVYVPHPFETVRQGLAQEALDAIAKEVDIVETHNGRAIFQNKSNTARKWADQHRKPGAASSDAHGWHGWGNTYTELKTAPTRATLVSLLQEARVVSGSPGVQGVLYPKFNRLRKKVRRAA